VDPYEALCEIKHSYVVDRADGRRVDAFALNRVDSVRNGQTIIAEKNVFEFLSSDFLSGGSSNFLKAPSFLPMFPPRFTAPVPAAGIKTQGGETVAQCMIYDSEYRGPDHQLLYRQPNLTEPGDHSHLPGIPATVADPSISFGKPTTAQNSTAAECLAIDPPHQTPSFASLHTSQESLYHRSRQRLGQSTDGVAQIPGPLIRRGFGISTQLGEPVGAIVQRTRQSLPDDVTLHPGYQTNRNYDWRGARLNPLTYTFGIKSTGNVDHLNAVFAPDHATYVVPLAVERASQGATVPDPDPLDPRPRLLARTMLSGQLNPRPDPAALPPAGVGSQSSEFTIGDTIAGMGQMDAFTGERPRRHSLADAIAHGVPTKPNPFKNPLAGPGKYASLGLSDEDFLKLREKGQLTRVMASALGMEEEEAGVVFDRVAARVGRKMISVAEFYDDVRAK
jgi:hypothetical protein